MRARKQRRALDAALITVGKVQKGWDQQKMTGPLFMDINGAFDWGF